MGSGRDPARIYGFGASEQFLEVQHVDPTLLHHQRDTGVAMPGEYIRGKTSVHYCVAESFSTRLFHMAFTLSVRGVLL